MVGIAEAKCILVLGATSGIGRALALALHALPSQPIVIVGGRRKERLDELCEQGERFRAVQIDINTSREALKSFVNDLVKQYPDLDGIMISSGIQHVLNFKEPEKIDLEVLQNEYNTNYVALITLIISFLPHFLKLSEQGRHSFIMPISSGLGIVPGSWVPNYSATKAAVHSFSLSLAAQLTDTNVHVMEIIPPLVESELHDRQGTTERLSKVWMPLDEYTKETMDGLLRGDLQVGAGTARDAIATYEEKKLEHMFSKKQLFAHK